jgi:succinate dehydrogenase / fumarate reductase, cytochrome b subunit
MTGTQRPLSPHLSVYKMWQAHLVTSILHRATGTALSVGLLLMVWGVLALAAGAEYFAHFTAFAGSPVGIILLVGWSWSLLFHLCNGVRHLIEDGGHGYQIVQFRHSSWAALIVSALLTVAVWACVLTRGVIA